MEGERDLPERTQEETQPQVTEEQTEPTQEDQDGVGEQRESV